MALLADVIFTNVTCACDRRIMYTSMSSVFYERVCDWYYLWAQLEEFPTLTEEGIDMLLLVGMTGCWLD